MCPLRRRYRAFARRVTEARTNKTRRNNACAFHGIFLYRPRSYTTQYNTTNRVCVYDNGILLYTHGCVRARALIIFFFWFVLGPTRGPGEVAYNNTHTHTRRTPLAAGAALGVASREDTQCSDNGTPPPVCVCGVIIVLFSFSLHLFRRKINTRNPRCRTSRDETDWRGAVSIRVTRAPARAFVRAIPKI